MGIVKRGLDDLRLVAPGITEKLAEQVDYFDELYKHYESDKLAYSVNAHYYGKERKLIDETRISAIAATIEAANKAFVPQSKVGESNALQRVALLSPITGAVTFRAIKKIGESDYSVAVMEGREE